MACAGLSIAVGYLLLHTAFDALFLEVSSAELPWWQADQWWTDCLNAAMLGYLPAAQALARRGVVRDLAELRPHRGSPVDLLRIPVERGWPAKIVWISDFADPEAAAPGLHFLRRRGRACVGWLPALAEDREPILDGRSRLRDPETGEEHVLDVDGPLRAAMVEELSLLARHQDAIFNAVGYPLVRFPLPAEGDFRLSSWFTGPWTFRL